MNTLDMSFNNDYLKKVFNNQQNSSSGNISDLLNLQKKLTTAEFAVIDSLTNDLFHEVCYADTLPVSIQVQNELFELHDIPRENVLEYFKLQGFLVHELQTFCTIMVR